MESTGKQVAYNGVGPMRDVETQSGFGRREWNGTTQPWSNVGQQSYSKISHVELQKIKKETLMRKMRLFLWFALLSMNFWGCSHEHADKTKIVEMTI